MKIIPFNQKHIQQATKLAELNFAEENTRLKGILPHQSMPDLSMFANNDLGVAAFDGDVMLGFIGCYGPLHNLFGKSDGMFSPIHANAAVEMNRKKIYSMMYQQAAKIWVEKGLFSHCIALYANNDSAIYSFFDNGFGKRCVDAIIRLDNFEVKSNDDNAFIELTKDQYEKVHSLSNLTVSHLRKSPSFMPRRQESLQCFLEDITDDIRIFAAYKDEKIAAYLKLEDEGETFISENESMLNVTGAHVLDEYRGSQIASNLLNHVVNVLKKENVTHLGVDYESINPAANNFWQKHFTPYTYSLTRRIDERITE